MKSEKEWLMLAREAASAGEVAGDRTRQQRVIRALLAEAATLRNELETSLRDKDQEAEAFKAVQANRRGLVPRSAQFTGEVRLLVSDLESLKSRSQRIWDRLYEIAEPLIEDED